MSPPLSRSRSMPVFPVTVTMKNFLVSDILQMLVGLAQCVHHKWKLCPADIQDLHMDILTLTFGDHLECSAQLVFHLRHGCHLRHYFLNKYFAVSTVVFKTYHRSLPSFWRPVRSCHVMQITVSFELAFFVAGKLQLQVHQVC